MICIGIPTLRPLYLKTRGINTTNGSHTGELPQFMIVKNKFDGPYTGSPGTPSTMASKITKPSSVYTGSPRNSPRLVIPEPHRDIGVINVVKEVRIEKEDANWPLLNQF